jgi:hypothetical protein
MTRTKLSFRNLAMAFILAATAAGATAGPALAADWHQNRDWRYHDARHHPIVYAAPAVAPQVIYADPAPVYYPAPYPAIVAAPAASLINIPLVIR